MLQVIDERLNLAPDQMTLLLEIELKGFCLLGLDDGETKLLSRIYLEYAIVYLTFAIKASTPRP
jgi:hypothetical protein